MNLEIERRFLVNRDKLPKLNNGVIQIQGYFCPPEKHSLEIRVRLEKQQNKKQSVITIKSSLSKLIRTEFEYRIPPKDAEKLLKLCQKNLEKIRYKTNLNGEIWVIDFFQNENLPLVIAEIELKSSNSKFLKPLWCSKEITNDLRFTAHSLAYHPFSRWRKSSKAGNRTSQKQLTKPSRKNITK